MRWTLCWTFWAYRWPCFWSTDCWLCRTHGWLDLIWTHSWSCICCIACWFTCRARRATPRWMRRTLCWTFRAYRWPCFWSTDCWPYRTHGWLFRTHGWLDLIWTHSWSYICAACNSWLDYAFWLIIISSHCHPTKKYPYRNTHCYS